MPKGIKRTKAPKKAKHDVVSAVDLPEAQVIEVKVDEKPTTPSKPVEKEMPPLGPGQRYFEAPDGEIIIDSDKKTTILYHPRDGRKPFLVNAKR